MARLPYARQGAVTYALKNRRTEEIIQITEAEKFLWEQMDGRASLQEIATAYLLRYGSFDFAIIPALIVKLLRADLLTMRPVSRLRAVLARNRRNPAARADGGQRSTRWSASPSPAAGRTGSSSACTATAASSCSRRGPSLALRPHGRRSGRASGIRIWEELGRGDPRAGPAPARRHPPREGRLLAHRR